MPRRPQSFAITFGVAATVILIAGVATASIPAKGGVIKGCYAKSSGALRVLGSAKKCPHGSVALNWAQKGKTGATGHKGSTGQTGPRGPGAIDLRYDSTVSSAGSVVNASVGGFGYLVTCNISALGATLSVSISPPSGVTFSYFESSSDSTFEAGALSVAHTDPSIPLSGTHEVTNLSVTSTGSAEETLIPLVLSASNGTSQELSVDTLVTFSSAGGGTGNCHVAGMVTPT
jgi:hypothetical protein